ncbi:MAG: hypothetical protein Q9191_001177 [Dirinaria sp. TL-2023a]
MTSSGKDLLPKGNVGIFKNEMAGHFGERSEIHSFNGFLFDLDGTIIDTTEAITKHWTKIGAELGVDPKVILNSSRGRRSIDTIKLYDASKANWDYIRHIETQIPPTYGSSASETPGSRSLLQSLQEAHAPWALVTSCTRALLHAWLDLLTLPTPAISVAAEDVPVGKPDPACYILGCERIGCAGQGVLVVEDSPSGVAAGKAAGCKVLGLATTHGVEKLRDEGADWIVRDLSSVRLVEGGEGRYTILIGGLWEDASLGQDSGTAS